MEASRWQLCASGEPSSLETWPSQEHSPGSLNSPRIVLMDGMMIGGMSRGACCLGSCKHSGQIKGAQLEWRWSDCVSPDGPVLSAVMIDRVFGCDR